MIANNSEPIVKVKNLDVFPQSFFEFYFPKDMITLLYDEVIKNQDEIKKISDKYFFDDHRIAIDYWTDWDDPVKLKTMDKIIYHIGKYFRDMQVKCDRYWTAIYGPYGVHGTHTHGTGLFQENTHNFSSVLYLTNIGSTKFHNPSTDNVMETEWTVNSQIGKMIMFPANILHSSPPHNIDKTKMIISANFLIRNRTNQLEKK